MSLGPLRAIRTPRLSYRLCALVQPYSSGSPSASHVPDDYFIKTGKREASDPYLINMRSDEYSKSGGDDLVAEQMIASFKNFRETDPLRERDIAGRGNMINPLEISPASLSYSQILNEQFVGRNVERDPSMITGYGIPRKAKIVEKTELDFRPK